MILYHGTSADNLQSILKDGICINTIKLWNCSQDEIYLWHPIQLAEANDRDLVKEADYIQDEAFRMAAESGQIALAAAKDNRIVVIKVEIDESELMADNSCENMEKSGAVCIGRNITVDEILEVKMSNDLSALKGYFINLIKDRDYCNLDFTPFEIKIADVFKKAELFPEDIDDIIEWSNVKINQPA